VNTKTKKPCLSRKSRKVSADGARICAVWGTFDANQNVTARPMNCIQESSRRPRSGRRRIMLLMPAEAITSQLRPSALRSPE
jgi:hypothetical protein